MQSPSLITRTSPINRVLVSSVIWFLIPVAVFTLHALSFGAWIVDDAAISFAYSRNLAFGHGLVAQVGNAPVEGYSNPLWVLLLAPFFRLGFEPVVISKLLSMLLVIAAYYLIYRTLHYRAAIALALVALSLNTSFVVWSISGLENPLYVFNGALLLWALVYRRSVLAGFAVALLATTRPDGLAYILVLPILALLNRWTLRDIMKFALATGIPYAAFLVLRYATFGALLPNTAVVKSNFDLISVRFLDLFSSMGGVIGIALLLVVLPLLVIVVAWRHKLTEELRCLLACLLVALLVFNVLPSDWMGEYRFGTLFFLFLYPSLALIFEAVFPRVTNTALLGIILGSVALFVPRTLAFQAKPVLPFQDVAQLSDALTEYAHQLNVANPSVLSPDAGGMLYGNTLTYIDLAGLTDTTIAPALYGANTEHPDHETFNNYILNEKRPTFVEIYKVWTASTNLQDVPEFQQDYMAVLECSSEPTSMPPERASGGWLYVRRDVFTGVHPDAALSDALARIVGTCRIL